MKNSKYFKSFLLLCCVSLLFQSVVAQEREQNQKAECFWTLDEIPGWIQENIKFPKAAYLYGMAGVEQFVVSAAWDGRVFITSGLNTLNPAFEKEIKSVLDKAPKCRFAGNEIKDIYKRVEIDFTAYVPEAVRSDIRLVERHLPPCFTLYGEKMQRLKGRERFVKWLSAKFDLIRKNGIAGYNDTIFLCYTVSESGKLKNIRVEDCKDESVRTDLESIMKRSPKWTPGITESKEPIPVSIKERVILKADGQGGSASLEIYMDDVCRNSTSAPTDPDMIVLNPEVRIRYGGGNENFMKTIHDNLQVDGKVKFAGTFVVEKDGRATNIHTISTDSRADSVIIALVEQARWIPAQQGGVNVRGIYTFAGVQLPPARKVYGTPPHKNSQKERWEYFRQAYPEVDAVVDGERKFKTLSYDDYQEALMMRGFHVVPIKIKGYTTKK
ncbi:energy transducer TonB [uncultured Bacteroides sp.]|uniref:energy transducer TonB n=1 Tax=uncultured Bacteroides sp. TaxID=162156 RepID=UPI0025E5B3A7|nr:hypothetical protein [uncultured Bacteroides sp.]